MILGSSDGIETGVLQLRRTRPLEVTELQGERHRLRVPTADEMLRVKSWVVVCLLDQLQERLTSARGATAHAALQAGRARVIRSDSAPAIATSWVRVACW